jgi:hypothetical protein
LLTHRTPLLKALPAIHRPPLSRLKGHGRFFPALGTRRSGFVAGRAGTMSLIFSSLTLAGPTSLGFVAEPLVGVEGLFPGGKYEFRTAICTLQNPVLVLHCCSRAPRADCGAGRRPRARRACRGPAAWIRGSRTRLAPKEPANNVPPWEKTTVLLPLLLFPIA